MNRGANAAAHRLRIAPKISFMATSWRPFFRSKGMLAPACDRVATRAPRRGRRRLKSYVTDGAEEQEVTTRTAERYALASSGMLKARSGR